MIGPRTLHPGELGDIDGLDLADAMAAARRLEATLDDATVRPSPGFADQLMAALADEPAPATAGFLVPLRRRGLLGGFGESVRQAWLSLGAGRPALARSAALAYMLVVAIAGASIAGAATLGAAGALDMLGPGPTDSPQPTAPEPTLGPPEPTVAPSLPPTEAPSVNEPSPTPSETPEESDDGDNSGPGGGGDGTPRPTRTDDGGNSGPGGGGDSSGPGNGGDDDRSGPGGGDSGSGSGSSGSGGGGSGPG